jgi:hypothetical protein
MMHDTLLLQLAALSLQTLTRNSAAAAAMKLLYVHTPLPLHELICLGRTPIATPLLLPL